MLIKEPPSSWLERERENYCPPLPRFKCRYLEGGFAHDDDIGRLAANVVLSRYQYGRARIAPLADNDVNDNTCTCPFSLHWNSIFEAYKIFLKLLIHKDPKNNLSCHTFRENQANCNLNLYIKSEQKKVTFDYLYMIKP